MAVRIMKNKWHVIGLSLFVILFFIHYASADIIPIAIKEAKIEDITNIIYAISGGIATVMIILHGFKWMTSDNDQDRMMARTGIIHVLLALMIIMLAAALVNLLFKPPTGYS